MESDIDLGRHIKIEQETDHTKELIHISENIDPITRWPYEVPGGTRLRLIGEITEAMKNGRRVFVCKVDLDRLKNINDTYGHDIGNTVIREFASQKKETIINSGYFDRTFFYRPQAGGDEYEMLLITKKKEEKDLKEKILKGLNEDLFVKIVDKKGNEQKITVNGTAGITERVFNAQVGSIELVTNVLQKMEQDAENDLEERKNGTVEKIIESTLKKFEILGIEEARLELAKEMFKNRRFSVENINTLLKKFEEKVLENKESRINV